MSRRLKQIIGIIGVIDLSIVLILNIVFTAKMDSSEHITISFNSIIYIIEMAIVGIFIFFVTKFIEKKLYKNQTKLGKVLTIIVLLVYIEFGIIWLIAVRPYVVADQIHVGNLAQTMYRGNKQEFLPNLTYAGIPLSQYIQRYQQQITLAFIYNIFFKIIHIDIIELLRILNFIGNLLIVFATYKICVQISKKHEINKVLGMFLILSFISLPMLATLVYGDIPGLAMSLFSIYYIMKYVEEKKIKHLVFSSIFMMLAYMMRMNSLIFIIATVIYLLLEFIQEYKQSAVKQKIISICAMIVFLVIAIMPSTIIIKYYLHKYELEGGEKYPTISYILMAMEESKRANGWYSESIGEKALKNPEIVKEEYKERIKQRLSYFSNNIGYCVDFYTMKISSMWSENTYSALMNNGQCDNEYEKNILTFYQKTVLILICICCIFVIIQNRKNLSSEVILLITIFIGGFLFHILWEAKSRYIIPYIVVLIPIASINIKKINIKEWRIYERVSKIYKKF